MNGFVDLDVLVIGAGFCGLRSLYKLRKAGFNVKCIERGSSFGGTWYSNRYPGARVDSEGHIYQLFDMDISSKWEWTERFPGQQELLRYFAFLEKEWDLAKDITFNKEVVGMIFDEEKNIWNVSCADGTKYKARWVHAAIGFAAKSYTPSFPGMDSFKGQLYHTNNWPKEDVDLKGKKVAIIGTGASAIQVIQEVGPIASQLTIYQRTPNIALPMQQQSWSSFKEKISLTKEKQAKVFEQLPKSMFGFDAAFRMRNTEDDTPEERKAYYQSLFDFGGLIYLTGAYMDIILSPSANDHAYNFWLEKTRARIKDPKKRDLLAPLKPPHPFGAKRASLEQNYYEVCNQDNVEILDVSTDHIETFTPAGIKTGLTNLDFDVIVLATGFDALTGSLTQIDIKVGENGIPLKDKWVTGCETYLGMTIGGYPNLFFTYGPQSPTAFCNGTTCTEIQSDWILKTLMDMRESGIQRLEATDEAQKKWSALTDYIWNMTLLSNSRGWYNGGNIPGKVVQALNWAAGVPEYVKQITECQENDYQGFIKVKA